MMAGLFLLVAGTLLSILFNKRVWALTLLITTIGLCWIMLWYHATDALKINW